MNWNQYRTESSGFVFDAASVDTPSDMSETLSERDERLEIMRRLGYEDPLRVGAVSTRMTGPPQFSAEPVVPPPPQQRVQTMSDIAQQQQTISQETADAFAEAFGMF